MAANPKPLAGLADGQGKKAVVVRRKNPTLVKGRTKKAESYHVYHAEAHVLSGHLKHPVEQSIEHHARVVLESRRANHLSESVEEFNLEGLISVKSGHTRVSGAKVEKRDFWGKDHSGWVTLSTTVLEGLNVFEVITADRLVAQVSTEHAFVDGHVPKVTFLGTRFENLRVGGYPVQLELDLDICGDRPKGDKPYLEDPGFLHRVEAQLKDIADAKGLPEDMEKEYAGKVRYINTLRKNGITRPKQGGKSYPKVECSLIKSIGAIPIPGVKTFGNVIFIPDFGAVSLAGVEVGIKHNEHSFLGKEQNGSGPGGDGNYFTLQMLNMRLGCIGGGIVVAASASTNGKTKP